MAIRQACKTAGSLIFIDALQTAWTRCLDVGASPYRLASSKDLALPADWSGIHQSWCWMSPRPHSIQKLNTRWSVPCRIRQQASFSLLLRIVFPPFDEQTESSLGRTTESRISVVTTR